MLNEVINHVREDVTKVSEPKAEALFKTTTEVLKGLITAYTHYETKAEEVSARNTTFDSPSIRLDVI